MEREFKNKFWKGVLVGALVTAFAGLIMVGLATGIFVIGNSVIKNAVPGKQPAQIVESSGEVQEDSQVLDMSQVEKKVELLEEAINNYFLFETDQEKMEQGIYKGLLSALEDPYTVYYTPEEYTTLTEETQGSYCGIGVLVSQNVNTKISTIIQVFPDSPAEKAGMKKGDILYEVDGVSIVEEDLDIVVSEHIRGDEGTYVDITVMRDGAEVSLHVQRQMVEYATVEHQMLADKTGYLRIVQFDAVTVDQFKKAVDDLEEQGMERLVIDLRDNPGGLLDVAVEIAAYLLPELDQYDGNITVSEKKDGTKERYFCDGGVLRHDYEGRFIPNSSYPKLDGHQVDVPIGILMNDYSASACEVLAGALRDYDKAILVGTTSYGKGIVQSLLPLGDGSAIKITTARYYTPAGINIHEKGLEPDVEVQLEIDEAINTENMWENDVPLDKDTQVLKAIEVLKEK